MSKGEIFFDAVTNIREDLIEEAQRYVFRRRNTSLRRYAALAACLFLVVCAGWNLLRGMGGMGAVNGMGGSGAASGAVSGDSAPPSLDAGFSMDSAEESGENSICEPVEPACFTASVLETGADYLLVVPLPGTGIWSVADRVRVPTDEAAYLPDIQPGDQILVVYTGEAGADYVTGVTEIKILE